jgi:type II secretory pathway component GspD/PulD (secretin)
LILWRRFTIVKENQPFGTLRLHRYDSLYNSILVPRMLSRIHLRTLFHGAAALGLIALLSVPARPQAPSSMSPTQQNQANSTSGGGTGQRLTPASPQRPDIKPDPKKAKEAYKLGLHAEQDGDWQAAFDNYGDAVNWAPTNEDYFRKREIAKSHVVQTKMDLAEREAASGRLSDARREMLAARYLDPTNKVVRDRLAELTALEPRNANQGQIERDLGGEVHLEHLPGKRSIDFRGNTQTAYDEVARQYGIEVAFDVDLHPRPVRLQTQDEDFPTTMRILSTMTGTFWRPLTKRLFFVAADSTQKRKDYALSVVRTVLLPAAETPEQMTELLRMVREIAGITRSDLDTRSRTLTMRASPQAIAVATDLIENLEQPVGQMVLEIEILDVTKTYAQQLGITPPQSAQVLTLSKQQIQEALSSEQGLISVIEEVFGTPSSLSGLSTLQTASLLGSQTNILSTLLPPLVLFGGGDTRFLATLPGASANFSQMLNVVRDGRRILLRAEDGQPATFFVGERIPVTLAQFSPSEGGSGVNVPGVLAGNFSATDFTTGNAPDFVTTASLRNNGFQDMIVANHTDNTLSIFLGNGDGTFATINGAPPTTGTGPVWVATGTFNTTNSRTTVDLAVANQTANTVSILAGNGDGTFQPKVDLSTGNAPSSVVAVAVNTNNDPNIDLIVANHGDNTLSVFLGNGDGTFRAPTTIAAGGGPSSIATGDFNGDGKIDLAVTNQNDNTVSIFLGNGDGTFQPRVDDAVGNGPVWVSVADFNGDGIQDLAIANNGAPTDTNTGDTVSILLGNPNTANTSIGNGTFSPGATRDFPAGNGPTSIAVADFNVDGLPDLAVSDETDNAVSLLLGTGGGGFGPNFELPVGTDPVSIATADFNGDGVPDAAIVNNGSNTVTVILNSSSFSGTANGLSATPFPGVEYLDIGVKVKATPRVHLNDEVSLQLHFEVSSLEGDSINGIPVIANQQVDQTVRVKNSQTAMLAGFLERQINRNLNGAPGIADIPAAGLLGSDQTSQNTDTELLFLITPHMVSLAPRKDHEIYAGRGSLEGPGSFGAGRGEPGGQSRQPIPQIPAQGQTPLPNEAPIPGQAPVQPPEEPSQQPPPQQQQPPPQQPPPVQPAPQDSPPAPPPG